MLALVASIHVLNGICRAKTWMVGTSPTMTGGRVLKLRLLRGSRSEDLLEDLRPDIRRLRA